MDYPFISVVIIGRNEGSRLTDCIRSVRSMDYPSEQFEIIYVDSDSSDNSLERAREAGAHRSIALTVKPLSAAAGRNRGLAEAGGEYVLFLDGDTLLNPAFIREALPAFSDEKIAIVFGHRVEYRKNSLYIEVCDLDWDRNPGFSETSAGDILIRKNVIDEIGGYREIIAGEDPEMSNRVINAGYKILHIDAEMVKHDLSITTFRQYWKHAYRSGYAYGIVSDLTQNRTVPLWGDVKKRNIIQGLVYTGLLLLSLASLPRLLPLSVTLLFYGTVIIRSFIKNPRKIEGARLNLLYSIHSHFQKIPIFLGHIQYGLNKKRSIIEYK